MQIGVGLPNTIPGTSGTTLLEWATRAEDRGFSTLATIGRIAYPNYDSLIALAGAAAVTDQIELLTNILLAPTRDPVLLAKEAASLDQLSGGRLTLGVGVGGREDDFAAVGKEYHNRGQRWDEALELIHQAWQGLPVAGSPKPVTPSPVREGGVPLLIGGAVGATIERVIRWGTGWTAGGVGAEEAAAFAQKVRQAWQDAGREGTPRFVALTYYALGENADEGATYLRDYYGYAEWVEYIAQGYPRTEEAVKGVAKQFEDVGFDTLIFVPTIADLAQIDLLADALL